MNAAARAGRGARWTVITAGVGLWFSLSSRAGIISERAYMRPITRPGQCPEHPERASRAREALRRAVWFAPRRAYLEALGASARRGLGREPVREPGEARRAPRQGAGRSAEGDREYPAAAFGYYNLGRVYMLYNYPLLTYAARGRDYFRKALVLQPADEFINVNVLTLFLGQWALLEGEEKEDAWRRLADALERNEGFLRGIRDLWKQTYGNLEACGRFTRRTLPSARASKSSLVKEGATPPARGHFPGGLGAFWNFPGPPGSA